MFKKISLNLSEKISCAFKSKNSILEALFSKFKKYSYFSELFNFIAIEVENNLSVSK